MTRKNLRLLAYGRVSDVRGRGGDSFISPDIQDERMEAFAKALGHTILDKGTELDRSGGDRDRPILESFLARVERGEADGIIVARLDRFARDNKGAWDSLERLKQANGELLCVEPNIDTSSATGRLVRDILLVTANWERERIGEQWQVAKARAVARGVHITPNVPPGYRRRDDDRRLAPDGRHATTIRKAYEMAASGATPAAVADYLNERALPSAGQLTFWQPNRIARLLANRVYLGEARSGNGHVNPDAHKALIDERTWLLAQSQRRGALGRAESVLAGLARCASCSRCMSTDRQRYGCTRESASGRCPAPAAIAVDRLEQFVVDAFLERAEGFYVGEHGEDADEAVVAAAEAERAYQGIVHNAALATTIGPGDFAELVAGLHKEWQAARARAAEARPLITPVMSGVALAEHVERLRAEGSNRELRELLSIAISAVFVKRAASRARNADVAERLHVVWRDDDEQPELPRRGGRFAPRPYEW